MTVNIKRWLIRSGETGRRLKRTAQQVVAGGALGALFGAIVEGKRAILGAACGAAGTFLAAYFQNTYNDVKPDTDPRTPTPQKPEDTDQ